MRSSADLGWVWCSTLGKGSRDQLHRSAPPPTNNIRFGSVILRIWAITSEGGLIHMYAIGLTCVVHRNMSVELALAGELGGGVFLIWKVSW